MSAIPSIAGDESRHGGELVFNGKKLLYRYSECWHNSLCMLGSKFHQAQLLNGTLLQRVS
jgi:hypothetical protein